MLHHQYCQCQLLLSVPKPSSSLHFLPVNESTKSSLTISSTKNGKRMSNSIRASVSLDDTIPSNAQRHKIDPKWRGGFSLGVDLGMSRTGIALSKGFTVRPLTVLELRGEKLELRLLQIAEEEEVDEFIVGLPKSSDGKETPQSNKVRSVAGRFAVRAAERGLRVYLQDEYGTSLEALDFMIDMGVKKSARQGKLDAYAAMMVLQRYFSSSGERTELVLPKQLELQEKLRQGPPKDLDFFPEELDA
ncbi:hypothetical protein MKW94_022365 [Papaver nudicaule]|uniref:YqgF/RNase H-like domain-containing protein n=1 Tax=Papaver nudicaule TaxID=74823 RepID=A0AA42AT64_PAPNU|nr:hypothetical protein [Papaver nudicaule]